MPKNESVACFFCHPFLYLLTVKLPHKSAEKWRKVGRWVYKDTFMGISSESKGRYKKDFEVGVWKDFVSKRLVTKRKYKDSICYTTDYHSNGEIRSFGISKMILANGKLPWFLSGEWKFYDSEGILLGTKIYEKSEPILETYTE
jgi:antitoxin component YwqK of YwqJK toxin-antitoxin module